MKQSLAVRIIVCALIPWLLAAGQQPNPQWAPDQFGGYASNQIIVEFQPAIARAISQRLENTNASPKSARVVSQKLNNVVSAGLNVTMNRWGVSVIRPLYPFEFKYPELAAKYGLDRLFIVVVPRGTDTPAMANAFAAHPGEVLSAGVDPIGRVAQLIPDDIDFAKQWNLHNTGQTGGIVDADIDATEAWALHTGAADNVIIAIVDSGVDSDPYNGVTPHPEFAGRMVAGINVVQIEPDDATGDDCFHGTHVAGIAAATGNNTAGVAGISWGAKIMPVDVLGAFGDGCTGSLSDLMAGITWAAEHGADVINISLQFYGLTSADVTLLENVLSAAHNLGAVLVCAAGNGVPNLIAYPGKIDQCLAISATDNRDERDNISNFGNELALAAPGRNIWSTWPNGGYRFLSGTSMATPHVSGLAALMKSFSPVLTNIEIEQILKDSAEDLGTPGWDDQFGYGRINAHQALVVVAKSIVGACCKPAGATGPGCENLTEEECNAVEPVGEPRQWQINESCGAQGQRCPNPLCLGSGDCFSGDNVFCQGGPLDGESCNFDDCECRGCCDFSNRTCDGGKNDGITCLNDSNCPGGTCKGFCSGGISDPTQRCVTHYACMFDGCIDGNCFRDGPGPGICNGGNRDGTVCNSKRDCECTTCECQPGCEQPMCCTDVCEIDSYCCEECWDSACAAIAASSCFPDCNSNGIPDDEDIAGGTSPDINGNGIPDECEDGSCCHPDGSCNVTLENDCIAGVWTVDGSCVPNLCPLPTGACCDRRTGLGGLCTEEVIEKNCQNELQSWTALTACIEIACEEIFGACCDVSSGLGGLCVDQVIQADCQAAQQTWVIETSCIEFTCDEVSGACCDRLDGFCRNGLLKSECGGAQPMWNEGLSCIQILCDPAMGACCNTRFGTCTTTILADCIGEQFSWTKGEFCSVENCPDPFIPTVSQWGLMILTLLLLIGAKVYFNGRNLQEVASE